MQINIYVEQQRIEFYGKLFLAASAIKQKGIKKVKLGLSKPLIYEFLNDLEKKNIINIYKDYWGNSEILLEIANLFNHKYFLIHEEEYLIFQRKFFEELSKTFISTYHFNNMDGLFVMSSKTQKKYKKILASFNTKFKITGNLRYSFMNLVKEKGHFELKSKKKFNLIPLNSPIFASIYKNKKKIQLNTNDLNKNIFTGRKNIDEQALYLYTREFLKLAIKLIKKNPKKFFYVRPYPSDLENMKYYNRLFGNYKNVKVDIKNDIFFYLKQGTNVFCQPENVSLESSLIGNNTFVYYNSKNKIHKYLLSDHPFIQLFKNNIFDNSEKFSKLLHKKKRNKNLKKKLDKLKEMYGTNNNAFDLIIKNINQNKFKKEDINFIKKIKRKLCIYVIKSILKHIKKDIIQKNYSKSAYENFRKKFKVSISRILIFFIFNKNSSRGDILNILYKSCLGRSYESHSPEVHQNKYVKFNINQIRKFIKFYKIKLEKNIQIKINRSNTIVTFSKI